MSVECDSKALGILSYPLMGCASKYMYLTLKCRPSGHFLSHPIHDLLDDIAYKEMPSLSVLTPQRGDPLYCHL